MSALPRAPDQILYRKLKAQDTAPYAVKRSGLNCHGYENVNITLNIVGGSDSVTAKFFAWSDGDAKFVPIVTASTYGPYTASTDIMFPANGRLIFVEIKGTVTDTKIYASGL